MSSTPKKDASPTKKKGGKKLDENSGEDKDEAPAEPTMSAEEKALLTAELQQRELDSKKLIIKQYMELFDKMREENQALREEMRAREADNLEVTKYLRKEIQKKTEMIQELKNELQEVERKLQTEAQKKEDTLTSQIRDLQEMVAVKDKYINELERSKAEFEKFLHDKRNMEKSLAEKDNIINTLKAEHEEEMTKFKLKLLEERIKLKKEEERMEQRIQKEVHERTFTMLDKKSIEIFQENIYLRNQQYHLEKKLVAIGQLKNELEAEHKKDLIESELNKSSLKEYSNKGFQQSREIKQLHAKIRSLESSLTKVVKDYEEEIARMNEKKRIEDKDTQDEMMGLRRLLSMRTKELHQLRKLAKRILHQRSELEMFFIESLDQVKKEIQRRKAAQAEAAIAAAGTSSPIASVITKAVHRSFAIDDISKFPPIGVHNHHSSAAMARQQMTKTPASHLPTAPGQKVDLKDLTWEDKEKVLRLLFSKINGAQSRHSQTQQKWKQKLQEEANNAPAAEGEQEEEDEYDGEGEEGEYADDQLPQQQQQQQQQSRTFITANDHSKNA